MQQVAELTKLDDTIIGILREMTQDWDLDLAGGLTPTTQLIGDLAFESIDLVQFAVLIEQTVGRKGLPFEKLFMQDGDYVSDLSVTQVAAFVRSELAA